MFELLLARVQDGQEPDLGPEVLRVGGDLLQGLGGGAVSASGQAGIIKHYISLIV